MDDGGSKHGDADPSSNQDQDAAELSQTPSTIQTQLDGEASPQRRKRSWWRYPLYLFAALLGAELLFFAWIWPEWDDLRAGRVPASALIKDYQERREEQPKLPALRWTPVQKAFPKSIKNVFVIAEDSRFYEHDGIDRQALEDAISYNYRHGKILLGASTISQQTAKNMFLSLSRNPLRKWHELLLTYLLEAKLSKAEILHIYLNVAEFGPGIYGLEAAARAYYKTSAHGLSSQQAVELAASLPSPKKNNPLSRTRPFQKRVARIAGTLAAMDRYTAESRSRKKPTEAAVLDLQKKLEALREERSENPAEPASVATPEATDAPATPLPEEGMVEGQPETPPSETEGSVNEAAPTEAPPADAPAPPPLESAPLEAEPPPQAPTPEEITP